MSQSRKARREEVRKIRKAERRSKRDTFDKSEKRTRKPYGLILATVGIGLAVALAILFGTQTREPNNSETRAQAKHLRANLEELVKMPEAELARLDLAEVNLICSEGLPGRGTAGFDVLLRRLDQIVKAVRVETARNYHQFTSDPAEFENSEEFFKVLILNTVIGQDFGLRYNPDKIAVATLASLRDQSFYESADDVFLSGLLGEQGMGTCSSMPVLLAAVGRRLGYPMKLVGAKGHLFCRWDDGVVRRNFDCTNGISSKPDEYYKKWPFPISDAEVDAGHYLKSLSPHEELSVFFSLRAQVLRFHGKHEEAVAAYCQADSLRPNHPDYQAGLLIARQTMEPWLQNDPSSPFFVNHRSRGHDPYAEIRDVMELNARNRPRGFPTSSRPHGLAPAGFGGLPVPPNGPNWGATRSPR